MKRLLVILLFVSPALAGIHFTGSHGSGNYTLDSGDNLSTTSDVQMAVAAASPGDTIFIPDPSPAASWTWNRTLTVGTGTNGGSPKNIKILGTGSGAIDTGGLIKITVTGQPSGAINAVLEDTSRQTFEIGRLWIDGYMSGNSPKIRLSGISTIGHPNASYDGGYYIHDVKESVPYYDQPDIVLQGTASWVKGTNSLTFTPSGGAPDAVTQLNGVDVKYRALFASGGTNPLTLPTGAVIDTVALNTITTTAATTAGNAAKASDAITTGAGTGCTITVAGKCGNVTGGSNYGDNWFRSDGWVEGLIRHCETDANENRYVGGHGEDNRPTSPTLGSGGEGTGANGDYAWFFHPTDATQAPNMAGTIHATVLEDNFFHDAGSSFLDSNSNSAFGGTGSIRVLRHNTFTGNSGMHGCRDSGGRGTSARLLESYNNHWILLANVMSAKNDLTAVESRGGEAVHFNNYATMGPGQDYSRENSQHWTSTIVAGYGSMNNGQGFDWGADGLNFHDLNQKGDFQGADANHLTHTPYVQYSHSQPATTGGVSNEIDVSNTILGDSVGSGLDSDSRFGDVYGTVSGGSYNSDITTATNTTMVKLTGATVKFTVPPGFPSIVPADRFRGLTIRNPNVSRSLGGSAETQIAFMYIAHSTSGPASTTTAGAEATVTTDLTFLPSRPTTPIQTGLNAGKHLPLAYSGTMELRKVKSYFIVVGDGSMSGNEPLSGAIATPTHFAGNDLSTNGLKEAGLWLWGNKRRLSTNYGNANQWDQFLVANLLASGGDYELIVPEHHEYLGDAQDIPRSGSEFDLLFQRGYQWDNQVPVNCSSVTSCADKRQLVGADWGKRITDHDRVIIDSTPGNTDTPYFVSFPLPGKAGKVGIGGNLPYPHPFAVAGPAPSATPAITSSPSATWTTNQANTFTVTTTGNPVPAFTPAPTPKPSFVTFTDNNDGTATMTGTPVTGDAAGSPYTFTISARNTGGTGGAAATSTQSFTLTLATPTVAWNSPADGQSFSPAPANILFSANASSAAGVTGVEFLNRVSTGPDVYSTVATSASTTNPYTATWSNVALGDYTVKARATQTGGATFDSPAITIHVVNAAATPSPAEIQVHP